MEPRIVERPAFTIMGVLNTGNPTALDYDHIWCRQFAAHEQALKAISTDGAYYGAYLGTQTEGVVDMIAGMAVDPSQQPLEGLVVRHIPAATYAQFECTMKTIGPTWQAIDTQWIPASGYTCDPNAAAFEVFPPGTEGEDATLSILVPIIKSSS